MSLQQSQEDRQAHNDETPPPPQAEEEGWFFKWLLDTFSHSCVENVQYCMGLVVTSSVYRGEDDEQTQAPLLPGEPLPGMHQDEPSGRKETETTTGGSAGPGGKWEVVPDVPPRVAETESP